MSRPASPGLIRIGSAGAVGTTPTLASDPRVSCKSAWFLNGGLLLPPEVGLRKPRLPMAGHQPDDPTVAAPCDSLGGTAARPRHTGRTPAR